MTTQSILCVISILLTVTCTVIIMFNIKTKCIKLMKHNKMVACGCFVFLIALAIAMIFVSSDGGLKYVLCLISGFVFPCIMLSLIFTYDKLVKLSGEIKRSESNNDN